MSDDVGSLMGEKIYYTNKLQLKHKIFIGMCITIILVTLILCLTLLKKKRNTGASTPAPDPTPAAVIHPAKSWKQLGNSLPNYSLGKINTTGNFLVFLQIGTSYTSPGGSDIYNSFVSYEYTSSGWDKVGGTNYIFYKPLTNVNMAISENGYLVGFVGLGGIPYFNFFTYKPNTGWTKLGSLEYSYEGVISTLPEISVRNNYVYIGYKELSQVDVYYYDVVSNLWKIKQILTTGQFLSGFNLGAPMSAATNGNLVAGWTSSADTSFASMIFFTEKNGSWIELQDLGVVQINSLAISADGGYAIVGDLTNKTIKIFTNNQKSTSDSSSNNFWVQLGDTITSDYDFGHYVKISHDGGTFAATYDSDNQFKLKIYTTSDDGNHYASALDLVLSASTQTANRYVDLSGDGQSILANFTDVNGVISGKVYKLY